MSNWLSSFLKQGAKADKKEIKKVDESRKELFTTQDKSVPEWLKDTVTADKEKQVKILSDMNLAEKITELTLAKKGLATNSDEFPAMYGKVIKQVEKGRAKMEKTLLKMLSGDYSILNEMVEGETPVAIPEYDEGRKIVSKLNDKVKEEIIAVVNKCLSNGMRDSHSIYQQVIDTVPDAMSDTEVEMYVDKLVRPSPTGRQAGVKKKAWAEDSLPVTTTVKDEDGEEYNVSIIDSTHINAQWVGSKSTGSKPIYHFNQAPKWMIDQLREQGFVEGNFFREKLKAAFEMGDRVKIIPTGDYGQVLEVQDDGIIAVGVENEAEDLGHFSPEELELANDKKANKKAEKTVKVTKTVEWLDKNEKKHTKTKETVTVVPDGMPEEMLAKEPKTPEGAEEKTVVEEIEKAAPEKPTKGTKKKAEVEKKASENYDAESMADFFTYLDELRESGATNMFGAGSYLQKEFDLPKIDARSILTAWMDTYGDGTESVETRAGKAAPVTMTELTCESKLTAEEKAKMYPTMDRIDVKKEAKSNQDVIAMFINDSFPKDKMPVWGTENLKIKKEWTGGWALVNYSTPIMYRSTKGELYFNETKYSVTTSKIQTYIKRELGSTSVTKTDEAGIKEAIENDRPEKPTTPEGDKESKLKAHFRAALQKRALKDSVWVIQKDEKTGKESIVALADKSQYLSDESKKLIKK